MSLSYRFIGPCLLTAAALAAGACTERGGGPDNPRKSGGAGFIDIETTIIDYECECVGELEGAQAEAACFDDYQSDDGELTHIADCIDRALVDHPDAQAPFSCLLDAQYDLVECFTAPPCSFTCDDGRMIHGGWVCDGESDCAGGEDEQQGCPAPHVCDGSSIPNEWVCDGEPDCSDGSDEAPGCEPTCLGAAFIAMESCDDPPAPFMDQVDECFGIVVSEPGECFGEGCDAVPECEDGACAEASSPSAVTMSLPAGPRRSRNTAIQAVRHLIQRR